MAKKKTGSQHLRYYRQPVVERYESHAHIAQHQSIVQLSDAPYYCIWL